MSQLRLGFLPGRKTTSSKQSGDQFISVGIWDISEKVTHLYELVEVMSQAQEKFKFFEVVASVPLGIEASAKNLPRLKKPRSKKGHSIKAPDLFPRVIRVRRAQRLDYLVGIVEPLVYDDDETWLEEPDDNMVATWRSREGLASINGVREDARKAKVSFESAVGYLILCILACLNQGRTLIHEGPPRGCIFDYDDEPEDFLKSLKAFRLCQKCHDRIQFKKGFGPVLTNLLEKLKNFRPNGSNED